MFSMDLYMSLSWDLSLRRRKKGEKRKAKTEFNVKE
jgi:hypothetical protein